MISFEDILFSSLAIYTYGSVFVVSLIGFLLYRRMALKTGILAIKNFRTLHEAPIPKGGGVVFSLVFISGVTLLWMLGQLSDNLLIILGVGGFFATLLGSKIHFAHEK